VPDPSPAFSYFRDWIPYSGKGATKQYADSPVFPLPGKKAFALSGTSLVAGTGAAGSAVLINPLGGVPSAYSETSNFTGPDSSPNAPLPPTELPTQHADFTTAPFPTAVDSVGIPSLRVTLSHVAPTDLVLFGKVYDVAPDGTATLIHRLIAPSRIPSAALAQPVDLKLLGFAHRFAKGHSARLTLATTDLTSYNNKVADVITVTTGPGSAFVLPYAAVAAVPAAPPVVRPRPAVSPPPVSLPSTGLPLELPLLGLALLGVVVVTRRRV
ncbi:MAG: hypothetical protein JWO12_2697, partial [Frankiales bacterium]|nr:hypothetical protein [Frankiales bacterium]